MVIADSNIWIHYLRNPTCEVGSTLQELLDSDRVLMTDVVLAEVLQARSPYRKGALLTYFSLI